MNTTATKNMTLQEAGQWEDSLQVGDAVQVWWGYGLAFRATGLGKIVKINRLSFQVELTEDVGVNPGTVDWKAGFILKGIPKRCNWKVWHPNLCVDPV